MQRVARKYTMGIPSPMQMDTELVETGTPTCPKCGSYRLRCENGCTWNIPAFYAEAYAHLPPEDEARSHELLPCPFCGNTELRAYRRDHTDYEAYCTECFAMMTADTMEQLVAAWNRRATAPLAWTALDREAIGNAVAETYRRDYCAGAEPWANLNAKAQAEWRAAPGVAHITNAVLDVLLRARPALDRERIEAWFTATMYSNLHPELARQASGNATDSLLVSLARADGAARESTP